MPILLYGLEICSLKKSDFRSLAFIVDRFFMKLFRTTNMDYCRSAELLSTFRPNLKTELFDVAYSEREHST